MSIRQNESTDIIQISYQGIYRKIKALKRICYRFKDMNHFYVKILLIIK